MGIMYQATPVSGFTNPPGAAETTVFATPQNMIMGQGEQGVSISGILNITAGAGTTSVSTRVRQTATSGGLQIGPTAVHTLAAGATAQIAFGVTDNTNYLNNPNGGGYCINVIQTGATGAGTINSMDIEVAVLWLPQAS